VQAGRYKNWFQKAIPLLQSGFDKGCKISILQQFGALPNYFWNREGEKRFYVPSPASPFHHELIVLGVKDGVEM
jgi:hypothetical protein